MKCLIITNNIPYPADKGEKYRTLAILESLLKIYEVDFVAITKYKVCEENINFLHNKCNKFEIFRINKIIANLRMLAALFCGQSLTHAHFYSHQAQVYLSQIDYSEYDFVFVVSSNVYLNIPRSIKKPILWDLIDLDSNKWNYLEKNAGNYFLRFLYKREAKILAKVEKTISEISTCFVINQREIDSYSSLNGNINCQILPLVMPDNSESVINSQKQEKLLVFSGNMDYDPNIASVKVLHESIFPLIQKEEPDIKVLIVGRNASANLIKECYKFEFTGEVKNASEYIAKAQVYLGYFDYFFGSPTKIFTAINLKIPIVTHSEIASLFELEPEQDVLIANSYEDFANQTLRLLKDNSLCEKLAENSFKKLSNFSTDKLLEVIKKHLVIFKNDDVIK